MTKPMINKFSDDQIADACMKYVNEWDMDTLLRFAYDEMYRHYTEESGEHNLSIFMEEASQ